jgi:membrane protein DedA with SNARE-associated domain
MSRLEIVLAAYGPIGVLIGSMFEGDITLLVAGAVAHLGFFHLYTAVVLGALGNLIADSAWYWLARRGSARLERLVGGRGESEGPLMGTVRRLADRLGTTEIVASRFVYGTRIVSMAYWGFRRLPFGRFLVADVAGCLIMSILLGTLGFFASHSAALLLGEIRSAERWFLGAVVLALVVTLAIHLAVLRRTRLRAAPPPAG